MDKNYRIHQEELKVVLKCLNNCKKLLDFLNEVNLDPNISQHFILTYPIRNLYTELICFVYVLYTFLTIL